MTSAVAMSTLYAVPGKRRRLVERPVEQPRDRRRARERDPRLAAAAHGRDADERERPALPLHRLQVDARVARVERRPRGSPRPARASSCAGRPRSAAGRAPRAGARAARRAQRRVEREQRGGDVGRVRRRAEVVREDRVLAVLAVAREALVPAVQAARPVEAPVPAARRLQQVAAERAHVAELRARGEPARLAQHVGDLRVALELARAARRRRSRPVADPAGHDRSDLDQGLRLDEAGAEERHELGAAREQAARRRGRPRR